MKLRNKFFPRNLIDIASFSFISLIVPFGYCFYLFYLLPAFHSAYSFWYIFHAFLGSYVFVNLVTNFLFIMLIDTSVNSAVKPTMLSPPRWNFCAPCRIDTPPRSWHCQDCDCCILKRDHHCQFTGCCIGHRNHRYFFFFLVYLSLGTAYGITFHTRFIFNTAMAYMSRATEHHESFILALVETTSVTVRHCFILFYGVTFFSWAAATVFLYYHATTIAKGMVMYERSHKIYDYDSGSVRKNFIQVLGERWYLTWISPLVTSELPSDGMRWEKDNASKRVI